jgi:hypothetical protein
VVGGSTRFKTLQAFYFEMKGVITIPANIYKKPIQVETILKSLLLWSGTSKF